jgi:FemAB-related protein (PEP-CTERM system-associated)
MENSQTSGILPLTVVRSMLFGKSLVSLPFVDYGGICADDEDTESRLFQAAAQILTDHRLDCLDLRQRRPTRIKLPFQQLKVTLVLALLEDSDRMFGEFDGKLRNQIRKAFKSGLSVSWCGADGLDGFYEVFAANMRDLGSPVHSRKFFRAILREFPESSKILLVKKDQDVIGGGLCLCFKDSLLVPWASSRRASFTLGPNNLLYWEAIRWGCSNGYKLFDFGRSSLGSGPYHFKKQWGAKEEPLYWQTLVRNGQTAVNLRPDDPKYQWLVQSWRRLPVALSKFIGPLLRKRLSN